MRILSALSSSVILDEEDWGGGVSWMCGIAVVFDGFGGVINEDVDDGEVIEFIFGERSLVSLVRSRILPNETSVVS
jgi:hypothetical protein